MSGVEMKINEWSLQALLPLPPNCCFSCLLSRVYFSWCPTKWRACSQAKDDDDDSAGSDDDDSAGSDDDGDDDDDHHHDDHQDNDFYDDDDNDDNDTEMMIRA